MLVENNEISSRQVGKLLIFEIISVSMFAVPQLAVKGSGRDGIFAILIGSVAAILYALFFIYVSKKTNGGYIDTIKGVFGRIGLFLFSMFYTIKFLSACWFTLTLFRYVINKTILLNSSHQIIIFSFILIGCYMASKGTAARAKVCEILFFIVLIPLIILFGISIKNVDILNIFPFFTTEPMSFIKTSFVVFLFYSPFEFILFIMPSVKKKGMNITAVMIVTVAIHSILFILLLGMLGITDAGRGIDSSVSLLKIVGLPAGFINRQDALILMLWLFSVFTIISAYFKYLTDITEKTVEKKSRYGYYFLYGALLFFLCQINVTLEEAFGYYIKYMTYVGMPQSVIIPLLVLVGLRLKQKQKIILR